MTAIFDRNEVRRLLSSHVTRITAARMGGNDLAVSHDIHDETMDILDAINERHGEAGVWRFMHMVEQTKREMDRGGVIHSDKGSYVVNRPQIAGPKKSLGGWIFALTAVVVAAMVFV